MNVPTRTWLAAALLATAVTAQAPTQQASTPQERLARAQLIETQEHDLAAAEQAYRTLLSDPNTADVAAKASVRLGALLWRLDRREDARTILETSIELADKYGGDRAAADEAKAILNGQGQDSKLAADRLTRARALVGLYAQLLGTQPNVSDTSQNAARANTIAGDLRALGAQAAEAIAECVDVGLRTGRIAKYPGADPVRSRLMRLLWEIGTQPAAIALRRWSEAEDVNMRLGAAEGCLATKVGADLEPVLLAYVRDPDPAGEVWRLAVGAVVKLTHEQHVELIAAPDAPARAAGLFAVAATWDKLGPEQHERFVERHAALVRSATRDADTRVVNQAWRVVLALARGPTRATLVFFAEADRYPGAPDKLDVSHRVDANDAWLHAIVGAARRATEAARPVLQTLLHESNHTWTSAAVDDVITLLDLGYGPPGGSDWALRSLRLATPEQLARLIALMPRVAAANWIKELCNLVPPPAAFPALRDLLEQCFAGPSMPWSGSFGVVGRMVRGRRTEVTVPDTATMQLLDLAVATLHPDAAAWVGGLVERQPYLAGWCAKALIAMSIDGAGAPAHAALRQLLVWEGTDQNELQPEERTMVFAELARVGDVAAIPLFPRAYELGLASARAMKDTTRTRTAFAGWGFNTTAIAHVCVIRAGRDAKPWHGYADADLVVAWRTLLDSPALAKVLDDLVPVLQGGAALRIPLAVLPLVIERLPKLLEAVGADRQGDLVNRIGNSLDALTPEHVAEGTPLRQALGAQLRSGDWRVARLLGGLTPDVAREFGAEAKALVRRLPDHVDLEKLLQAGIELSDDEWTAVLRAHSSTRTTGLRLLPKERGPALRAVVEEQLAHERGDVRIAAASAVQRLYGADSVASLLPLLQDQAPEVREHVRKALDQLREDAEQRSFWANAGSGIDTSQRGAASKLLAQAKAGEPKEQRILALRSLAVLGAAEALPYLIDATKDKDGDVATAARDAIAAIHTKSGAPAPANK